MGRKKRHSDRADWDDDSIDDLTPEPDPQPKKAGPLQARLAALNRQRNSEKESSDKAPADKKSERDAEPATAVQTKSKEQAKKQSQSKSKEQAKSKEKTESRSSFTLFLSYLLIWTTALTLLAACLFASSAVARKLFAPSNDWIRLYVAYPAAIILSFWIYIKQCQYLFLVKRRRAQSLSKLWIYCGAIWAFVFAALEAACLTRGEFSLSALQSTFLGLNVFFVGWLNSAVNAWRQKRLIELKLAQNEDFIPEKLFSKNKWEIKLYIVLFYLLFVYLATTDLF